MDEWLGSKLRGRNQLEIGRMKAYERRENVERARKGLGMAAAKVTGDARGGAIEVAGVGRDDLVEVSLPDPLIKSQS
jgi:hypothetical protein